MSPSRHSLRCNRKYMSVWVITHGATAPTIPPRWRPFLLPGDREGIVDLAKYLSRPPIRCVGPALNRLSYTRARPSPAAQTPLAHGPAPADLQARGVPGRCPLPAESNHRFLQHVPPVGHKLPAGGPPRPRQTPPPRIPPVAASAPRPGPRCSPASPLPAEGLRPPGLPALSAGGPLSRPDRITAHYGIDTEVPALAPAGGRHTAEGRPAPRRESCSSTMDRSTRPSSSTRISPTSPTSSTHPATTGCPCSTSTRHPSADRARTRWPARPAAAAGVRLHANAAAADLAAPWFPSDSEPLSRAAADHACLVDLDSGPVRGVRGPDGRCGTA